MEQKQSKNIVIVAGPTAVGKTSYAIDLALKIGGEVVSADSMQIYKGLEIGTAKPSEKERSMVVHHLIDYVDPAFSYSVFDYRLAAGKVIDSILASGKVPVICGGTGLYIHSLIYDMDFQRTDKRNKIREAAESLTAEELALKLQCAGVDLKEDDLGNRRRLARMLQVIETTGEVKSFDESARVFSKYSVDLIVLNRNRAELYDRINQRVDVMLRLGLVDEVRNLLESGLSKNAQSMKAIAYREVISFLNGDISYETMVEEVKKNTRHYAKRQLTWFRRYKFAKWMHLSK